jgi:predicted amidophosphoribosyltransferase
MASKPAKPSTDICPTCHRPYNLALPRRFCSLCKKQITRHHKWCIGPDGRIRHRQCGDPKNYPAKESNADGQ